MKHAISIETAHFSKFFVRLFDRYSNSGVVEIDGNRFGPSDLNSLKESWCTNKKIRNTRDFSFYYGRRLVASFHDGVEELWVAEEERDWIHALSEERLLRYRLLPDQNSRRLPIRIGVVVGAIFLAASLLPYVFVGEYWGMVWFLITFPISNILEDVAGIGVGSYGVIGLITIICATAWAAIAYFLTKFIQR